VRSRRPAHARLHDGGDAVAREAFRAEVAMLVDRAEHPLPRLQPSERGPGFERPACGGARELSYGGAAGRRKRPAAERVTLRGERRQILR
jgi:hypothetical protein